MIFVEGIHYSREGAVRTLLIDYTFPEVVPGFEGVSVADFGGKTYMLNGVLHLAKGFRWDGASGPTRDRWFNGRINAVRGPMGHDGLYEIVRDYLGRLSPENRVYYKAFQKAADVFFYNVNKEDGMPRWRRSLWYRAVRWAGWKYITGRDLPDEAWEKAAV